MRKLVNKFKKENSKKNSERITNQTVAEHREKVISGGKKYKYPLQYTKHKLVFNTIIIVLTVLFMFIIFTWWQLYIIQNSNNFFYRVTRIVPLPVAIVEGHWVRYSDYLTLYRPVEHFIRENGQLADESKDQERQLNLYKRSVLTQAEANAYAEKLANQIKIKITDSEINEVVARGRQALNGSISQELYDASLFETLGLSRDEYRSFIKQSLIYKKVAYELDKNAKKSIEVVQQEILTNSDINSVVQKLGNNLQAGSSGGYVQKSTPDGGLAQIASTLSVGQFSDIVKSTNSDGYYIVKLDGVQGEKVLYSYIKAPLTEFKSQFEKLQKNGQIAEFIDIPEISTEER